MLICTCDSVFPVFCTCLGFRLQVKTGAFNTVLPGTWLSERGWSVDYGSHYFKFEIFQWGRTPSTSPSSREEMLFCVQTQTHHETPGHGAAQRGRVCVFQWPWLRSSPHSLPLHFSGLVRCKGARVPVGLGAELQMSGPAWPLSARVMHEAPTAPWGLCSHHLLCSSSEVVGRSK